MTTRNTMTSFRLPATRSPKITDFRGMSDADARRCLSRALARRDRSWRAFLRDCRRAARG